MSERGIPPFDGTQSLVLTALNSAGWTPHEDDEWIQVHAWDGHNTRMLLSSSRASIGWYADTLGVYPVQLLSTAEPIERVELWKRR